MSADFIYQFSPGLIVPSTTEEKVFWGLHGTATAAVGFTLANSVEIGLVVAVASFELIEGAGCLSFGSLRNAKLLSDSPRKLCSVGPWVL